MSTKTSSAPIRQNDKGCREWVSGYRWKANAAALLSATLSRAKKMAFINQKTTIGRETNDVISIIFAVYLQYSYGISCNTNFGWFDTIIDREIFVRLTRHLKTWGRTRKRAERG